MAPRINQTNMKLPLRAYAVVTALIITDCQISI